MKLDGKVLNFRDYKTRSLYLRKKKAINFRWTISYRKLHKASKTLVVKKKVHRIKKPVRPIAGFDMEQVRQKREMRHTLAKQAAIAEAKKRRTR